MAIETLGAGSRRATVKDIIRDTRMQPEGGTQAPVLEDKATGRVRVIDYAAGDNVNVSDARRPTGGKNDVQELTDRRRLLTERTSADSPDGRVVEGVGIGIRDANEELAR